LNALVLKTSKG